FSSLDQGRIPLLGHGEERRVALRWYTHQRRKRSQVFALSLSHLSAERVKVQRRKNCGLILTHDIAIIGTAGGARADTKRVHPGSIRGGLQYLGGNFLLALVICPGQFP